jgi:PAS domain S-box-containing protein
VVLVQQVGGGNGQQARQRLSCAQAARWLGRPLRVWRNRSAGCRRWLEASDALTAWLLSGAEPAKVLAGVTRQARELSGADLAVLALPGAGSERLIITYAEGEGAEAVRGLVVPVGRSLSGRVLGAGQPLMVTDFATDDRTAEVKRAPMGHLGPAAVFPLGVAGYVCGVLTIGRRRGAPPFAPAVSEMAASFAAQAGIALELAERRRDIERLSVFADRDRIARDLHDQVIQRLYVTGMSLQGTLPILVRPEAPGRIQGAVDALDDTIRDIRATVFALQSRAQEKTDSLGTRILAAAGEMAPMLGFAPSVRLAGLDGHIRGEPADHALTVLGSSRDLDALFDQSPLALVFCDRELRAQRTNAAFRQMVGLPDEAIIGRRLSEVNHGMDAALIERTLTDQVVDRGVPVVDVYLEQALAGKRRVLSWSAYRVTENGQVLGAMGSFTDVTGRKQAVRSLRQAHARLGLLERAGSQVGATLDIHRTAWQLADLAVPGLADRIAIDLCGQVLQGENPPRISSGTRQFRRVVVRDATTRAKFSYKVGDLITVPVTSSPAVTLLRGKPLLARNPAEIRRQAPYTPSHAEALLARGVHTLIAVPLIARGITLGIATLSRAENPEPYGEADVRLVSDLVSRAAVHIDNARLYTREHNTAVTLQRSLLPQDIPQVAGLQFAHRYQPASRTAEVGGDWFDVISLEDGQVALVVGDVIGHGIHAAAIMGQLRTTTAALARVGCPPEEIMGQLSRVVAGHGEETGATCLYAQYDLASRRCRLTSAGHPPPALRHPDGTTEFIDMPGGMMLGVGQSRYPAVDKQLPVGSVLALYTDGLIEYPGQDISTGMSRLARTLATSLARSLDDLCGSVLASLGAHARDDITLLLARTTTETAR